METFLPLGTRWAALPASCRAWWLLALILFPTCPLRTPQDQTWLPLSPYECSVTHSALLEVTCGLSGTWEAPDPGHSQLLPTCEPQAWSWSETRTWYLWKEYTSPLTCFWISLSCRPNLGVSETLRGALLKWTLSCAVTGCWGTSCRPYGLSSRLACGHSCV